MPAGHKCEFTNKSVLKQETYFSSARKRSLGQGNIFRSVVSRILFTGGGSASVHAGIPSPWASPLGAGTPWHPPWIQALPRWHTPLWDQAPPRHQAPPQSRACQLGYTVNERAVCILLECNLVMNINLLLFSESQTLKIITYDFTFSTSTEISSRQPFGYVKNCQWLPYTLDATMSVNLTQTPFRIAESVSVVHFCQFLYPNKNVYRPLQWPYRWEVSAQGGGVHHPLWTEFLTHACVNITFLQLLFRTVIKHWHKGHVSWT